MRAEIEYKGADLDIDVNIINAEKLHKIVQSKFLDFIYDSECRTRNLKDKVNSIILSSNIDLRVRTNKLKSIIESKFEEI